MSAVREYVQRLVDQIDDPAIKEEVAEEYARMSDQEIRELWAAAITMWGKEMQCSSNR